MLRDPFLEREREKYVFPIPSRELILFYLAERGKPVNRKVLAQELGVKRKDQLENLCRRLSAMERTKQLVVTGNQCYTISRNLNLLKGVVIGHRDGFGFLRTDERKKNDYYLSHEQMRIAIHGDKVMAFTYQDTDKKNKHEAQIIRILVPQIGQIVGRFFTCAYNSFVVPNDRRFNFKILIPPEETKGARIGLIVVIELTQRPNWNAKAVGKVIKILGETLNASMAIDIALRTHNILYSWPQEVKQQIANLQEEVPEIAKRGRVDIRTLPLVTIDSEEAQDFDDAVYCEEKRDGSWFLWVAIADMSYYVRPYTPLDKEAIRRTTSIYFPSQVIPMLPEKLSHGLCSLNPQVDRLCVVCEMVISSQGCLLSYKFYEAVMNSYARLTYNEVSQILQGHKKLCFQYKKAVNPLMQLHKLYQTLEKARVERGGITFETEEIKFIFNASHRIKRIESVKRNDAHKLIEECMILANTSAARFVEKHKEPVLYRVHDKPSNEHITLLRIILKERGLILGGGDNPGPKDYADIINLVANRPDHEILQTILLRSMKQAIYDPENRGHFGLALQAYAHFTSPVRRYPDLVLHRAIKYLLGQKNGRTHGRATPSGGWHSNLKEMLRLGQQCSLSERRADEATRSVTDWLKCDFIQEHIGKIFTGIIINIFNFGFFVRVSKLFIDGLVHISSLDNDYYRYDSISHRLVGEFSGKIYQLGDIVRIRVETVNVIDRKIDFSLISDQKRLSNRMIKKLNINQKKRISKKEKKNCYNK
ncbi:ribonuclease R [Sodalis sp. CWE]|uniref:ribonuclease R n=1 Tax=Sodalis sp. CWE TaxID=2803816 RepID=UPI001C7D997B|nr:ribonuclease R [Sodalis sp. CWE]MBX4180804.1 ribonuclease R [Sodalis sp. CWE]